MDEPINPVRPRVAAIVLNSVSHDTRVLKEADSLQEAGYDVAIYGIRDSRCPEPTTCLPNGVTIHRCEWRGVLYRLLARLFLAAGLISAVLVGTAYLLGIDWLVGSILALPYIEVVFKLIGLAIVLGIVVRIAMVFSRKLSQTANRYELIDGKLPTEKSPSARTPSVLTRIKGTLFSRAVGVLSRPVGTWVKQEQIVRAIADFEPHIVHCHDLSALPIGCAYARQHDVRVVYDSHEIYEAVSVMTWSRRRRLEFMQRRYSRYVDLFVTINESIADYLNQKYPKLPQAVVVKNAARQPKHPIEYDGRLHEAAQLDRSVRILLYQGGFSRFRGLSILLDAAPLLPDGWALVMMGWGTLEAELKSQAAELDPSSQRIRFVPGAPLEELPYWTAGGTLGVIPYENVCLNHWFCTPNKLWEYPIADVPILASRFPELERTIEQYGIGRLLPDPLSPRDIAEAVASIDDHELQTMQARCRDFLAEDNWQFYARRLVEAYRTLAAPESAHDSVPTAPATADDRRSFSTAVRVSS